MIQLDVRGGQFGFKYIKAVVIVQQRVQGRCSITHISPNCSQIFEIIIEFYCYLKFYIINFVVVGNSEQLLELAARYMTFWRKSRY